MLEVLYEDNHLIAINKKSGDIVQGDKTGDAPLSDFVKAYVKTVEQDSVVIVSNAVEQLVAFSPDTSQTT